jgi:hypothetical protein
MTVDELWQELEYLKRDDLGKEQIYLALGNINNPSCIVENIETDEEAGKVVITWKQR